ncbi:MAG: twin-arginine translocation signal domain-containing protein, partial [Deltaproteobacteria bacterium]|nr:twin-arginine translocation signal domain-containing protein [Deltaproteobacteria bacterium]
MSISRRKFLSGLAAGAGTLASSAAGASSTHKFDGYPGRYGMLFDSTLCVGCRSCEQACKEVNELPPLSEKDRADQSVFETTRRVTPDSLTVVNRYV